MNLPKICLFWWGQHITKDYQLDIQENKLWSTTKMAARSHFSTFLSFCYSFLLFCLLLVSNSAAPAERKVLLCHGHDHHIKIKPFQGISRWPALFSGTVVLVIIPRPGRNNHNQWGLHHFFKNWVYPVYFYELLS